jgi:carbonic anhydrase
MFDDLVAANRVYAASFGLAGLEATARKRLAVLTCIDSRIEPLAMLGLAPGDAKILRNAGARVTDDVLRSLALAVHLLGVQRVCVVQHTGCALIGASNDELRAAVTRGGGAGADACDFLPIDEGGAALRADLDRIRTSPLLPADLDIAGFVYDVRTGRLGPTIA